MNHPPDSERAISDVLGAVLLIGVIVTVLGVAGVMMFSQPQPQKIPALNAQIWNDSSSIYIRHNGGDSLLEGELQIQVDGTDDRAFNLTTKPTEQWVNFTVGDTLQTSMLSSNQFPSVQIIYRGYQSSGIVLASYGLAGTSYGTLIPTTIPIITTTTITTTTTPPSILPVTAGFTGTPTSGVSPLAVQFTDASTGPVTTRFWTFGDGGTSIVTSPLYTYTVAGNYSVSLMVGNGTGHFDTLTRTGYINVTASAPAPTVTSRSNATLTIGSPAYELIGGTGFVSGATSVLNTTAGNSISSTTCDVRSSTEMFCSYNLAGATVSPSYRVAVINPDGQSGLNTIDLVSVINSPAPTLTARNPTTAKRGWPVNVALTGTNFQNGATVNMTRSGVVINAYNVVVVSSTSITCTFNLVGAAVASDWLISVTNPDLQSSNTMTFTITSPRPTLTERSPVSATRNWPAVPITLTGTDFQPGATVNLTRLGVVINADNVVVVSPTSITCTVNLVGVAAGTAWVIRVTNTDGQDTASTSITFGVTNTITVTGITPNTGKQGTTVFPIYIAGTGFQPGITTAGITVDGTTGLIYLTNINVVSSTQIAGTLVIPNLGLTKAQTRYVRVTNLDGSTARSGTRIFTVTV